MRVSADYGKRVLPGQRRDPQIVTNFRILNSRAFVNGQQATMLHRG
jgi:hypothetical protein